MCAIVGIHTQKENVCLSLYNALTVLQHRGQDASGMSVFGNESTLKIHKNNGLVRDVFSPDVMEKMMGGTYGIGHARYPTAGQIDYNEAQPFYVNSPFGIVLVHNGNLVNAVKLKDEIQKNNKRHINSTSDSEILLNFCLIDLVKIPCLLILNSLENSFKDSFLFNFLFISLEDQSCPKK